MKITPDTVEKLRSELAGLPPKPKATLTARDVVVALAPDIRAQITGGGYSLKDISEELHKRGIKISASTLGSYLRAIAAEQKFGKPASRARTKRSVSTES
ncbi:hypothetical protein [Paracoccus siganidrum]|uniref:Uncharacterized protein n=1 Tax=Paracoccus siganidrum TaxID=1276757 RepID=A0A419A742_9RHOB|nr:hypothetical protein [Paracoccus siganidrum]RJL15840.1 hypothetical protein D3P05_10685 [Paracoccus siganidrum]RMC29348.1 hypothetical protein C9E82_20320 [Paracoccus siganidrum]